MDMAELKSKKLLTRKEAAVYIGIGTTNMYFLMHSPEFPALVRINGKQFVNRNILDEWIDSNTGPESAIKFTKEEGEHETK